MNRIVFFILIIALFAQNSSIKAQFVEAGAWMGTSNYLGDLTPPQQFFLETRFATGFQAQYNVMPNLGFRAQTVFGQLAGDDLHSSSSSGRYQRNLDFRSSLWEFSIHTVWNVLAFKPSVKKKPITPFAYIGGAVFGFNPKTQYDGKWVALQPLGTEGQGIDGYPEKYKRVAFAIPFGGGIKAALSKRLYFSFEMGLRKTFTDYIDDVSGKYVDVNFLRQHNGDLAATLSNRTVVNGQQVNLTGEPRGHAGKDWYTTIGVQLNYGFYKDYAFRETVKKPKKKAAAPKPGKPSSSKWL